MDADRHAEEKPVVPERTHDQPAEGGREQADAATGDDSEDGEGGEGADAPDPEAAGIVDQQGAALREG